MTSPNHFTQYRRDINHFDFRTLALVFGLGNGVRHHELFEYARLDYFKRFAREDTVSDNGEDARGTCIGQVGGSETDGTTCISYVIHKDGDFVLDATDDYHA